MNIDHLEIKDHSDSVWISVRARAGASREGIVGIHGTALKIAVRVAPEKGKANAALAEILADALGVRRNQVTLVKGETNPDKVFAVRGLNANRIMEKLIAIL